MVRCKLSADALPGWYSMPLPVSGLRNIDSFLTLRSSSTFWMRFLWKIHFTYFAHTKFTSFIVYYPTPRYNCRWKKHVYSFDMSMDTERIDLLVECEESSLLDIRGTVLVQFMLCSLRSLPSSKRMRHLSHSSDRYLLKITVSQCRWRKSQNEYLW